LAINFVIIIAYLSSIPILFQAFSTYCIFIQHPYDIIHANYPLH